MSRYTEDELDELRENFNHFDSDHDGHIDRSEFGRLLEALGAGGSQEECDIGFEAIDRDANGTIEFREFSRWWSDR